MSNVKQLNISGWLPFNTYENKELNNFLGYMNAPSIGVRIAYGGSKMVPNENGGQTAMYNFVIAGQEAVSWGWIDALYNALNKHGAIIERVAVQDIEDTATALLPGDRTLAEW